MDFCFIEDQLLIQLIVCDFVFKCIVLVVVELDVKGEFLFDNICEMGQFGLMGIEVLEEYGGVGMDIIVYVLVMIEIVVVDVVILIIMLVNNLLFCNGIFKYGIEEQKQKYVCVIVQGEVIGVYVLIELQFGFDVLVMYICVIKNENGDWVINGKKSWIIFGLVVCYIVLFVIIMFGIGVKGVLVFIIDMQKFGFYVGKIELKLGICVLVICEIEFNEYVCLKDDVLGEIGKGFFIVMGVFDVGCIGIVLQVVGIVCVVYEVMLQWLCDCKVFGYLIGIFQMIQVKIVDMKCKLDVVILFMLCVVWIKMEVEKNGGCFNIEVLVVKLVVFEVVMWIVYQVVQIYGGMGYFKEMLLECYFCDVKIIEIYEGISEIQCMVIVWVEIGLC